MPTFDSDAKLSDAIKEAYASAPTDVVILHTMEIRHPSFDAPVRVVRDTVDLQAFLEADAPENPGEEVAFIALFFDFTLPEESAGASSDIEIKIMNVGRVLMENLDAAVQTPDPIHITYRPYLSTDLSAPHMDPPITLTIRSISANPQIVTATAGYGDVSNRRFPKMDYTAAEFPGLSAT